MTAIDKRSGHAARNLPPARPLAPGEQVAHSRSHRGVTGMATSTNRSTFLMQVFLARVLLFVMAGIALYVGYAVLTSLMTAPLTLVLWLVAAVVIGIAVDRMPEDSGGS
jgi:hypothetical protein